MKIDRLLKQKHTADCKRVRPTRAMKIDRLLKRKHTAILFITHQLPKGLQVDKTVVLGKNEANQT